MNLISTKSALALILAACFLINPVVAQDEPPLSAIDWLSEIVRTEPNAAISDDVSTGASPVQVETMELGLQTTDAIGILPLSLTEFPSDFWEDSQTSELTTAILRLRTDMPPPLQRLLMQVLLAELPPPADQSTSGALFLTRLDKLLQIGALDQAKELLDISGPANSDLFNRWFDVLLLIGNPRSACEFLAANPEFPTDYPVRIYCLAQNGDWATADNVLSTGRALGLIDEPQSNLLERFLHPELGEGAPLLPIPERITPLNFHLHDAIGEPLSLGGLPNAFAYTGLSERNGWKTRISSAERLVRTGALPAEKLRALYIERRPAASGGVWDRAAAIQAIETAKLEGNSKSLEFAIEQAVPTLRRVGLGYILGELYGPEIALMAQNADQWKPIYSLMFFQSNLELERLPEDVPKSIAILLGIETSNSDQARGIEAAAIQGITDPGTEAKRGNVGERLLESFAQIGDGRRTDPADLARGLAQLRILGFSDVAQSTALHTIASEHLF